MRLVANAKGEKGVSELAAEANLSMPAASIYLRALNARGLISVRRAGSFVYYGTASDRSLPVSVAIQRSFRNLFARKSLPKDWTNRLMPLLKAYSHPRRVLIVETVKIREPVHYFELQQRTGIGDSALARHLSLLASARVICNDDNGRYRLARPANSLAAAFLSSL